MPISLSISPAIVEFQLKPGASFTQAYQIVNTGSHPEIITPSILPWSPSPLSPSPDYLPTASYPGFSFSLTNADAHLDSPLRLEPGTSRQLVLKVSASANAPTQDGYFTLFITTQSFESTPGSSSLSARIGSHLLLSVNPEIISPPPPTLQNLTISPRFLDSFLTPIIISGTFKNPSPHFTKIQGQIEISKSGQTIHTLTLAPDNVLASDTRSLRCLDSTSQPTACQLSPPFWPGLYQIKTGPVSQNFYIWPITPLIFIVILVATSIVLIKLRVFFRSSH